MKIQSAVVLFVLALFCAGCSVMQSAVKSTFPYTAVFAIPQTSRVGIELSATSDVSSFDKEVSKKGSPVDKIKEVRIVSARLRSTVPSDFNIGNFESVKIYLSKSDGTDEVLVASRTDITAGVGNSMVLDIDNSHFLDEIVRDPKMKVRLACVLHNHINVTANVKVVLGFSAQPK